MNHVSYLFSRRPTPCHLLVLDHDNHRRRRPGFTAVVALAAVTILNTDAVIVINAGVAVALNPHAASPSTNPRHPAVPNGHVAVASPSILTPLSPSTTPSSPHCFQRPHRRRLFNTPLPAALNTHTRRPQDPHPSSSIHTPVALNTHTRRPQRQGARRLQHQHACRPHSDARCPHHRRPHHPPRSRHPKHLRHPPTPMRSSPSNASVPVAPPSSFNTHALLLHSTLASQRPRPRHHPRPQPQPPQRCCAQCQHPLHPIVISAVAVVQPRHLFKSQLKGLAN
ncbi:hypothetical protein OF83DRAFT_1177195 [Amylostereum chailletii]|nr:hypothetical protein OF83DRAFT_1177195 [Amylostereum chailletii]